MGEIAHNVDALRGLYVRYDTPLMKGFVLSAAAGENGFWDVAVRYQTQSGPLRFAGGVGYMDDGELGYRDAKGSASLLYDPTGLYLSVAGGLRDDDTSVLSANGLAHFHYLQAGISKQWLPYGKTTLYADYGSYKNFNVGHLLRADLVNPGQFVIWGTLAETQVQRWGFGAEQSIDKMGVLLYAQAHHYQARVVGFPCDPKLSPPECGGDPDNLEFLPMKPWQAFRCRDAHSLLGVGGERGGKFAMTEEVPEVAKSACGLLIRTAKSPTVQRAVMRHGAGDAEDKGGDAPIDAYTVLGVKPGASIQEARVAWLMRVEALHPDAGFDDPAASEQLKAINLAYQTLKTLEQGETGREPQRGTFGGVRATLVIFLSLPVVAVALTMANHRARAPDA